MNKTTILTAVILITTGLAGCGDKGTNTNPAPEITSISPASGPTGATVTISGSGFGETASENKVTFNGVLADIFSASETSIEAAVPEGAESGAVAVAAGGQIAIGPNFTVDEESPGITSVEPDSGTTGTQMTITGVNFSSAPEENIVTFNGGVISEVQQASDTSLTTTVPEGAESGPIQVEVDGEKTLSPSFTVIQGTGSLEVTASTTGQDSDLDGYTLTLRSTGQQRVLDPLGTALFEDVAAGDHELEISEVADNCSVDEANPRTITVSVGETAEVTFNVVCTEIGQIAFVSDRSGGNEGIFLIRADGSNPDQLWVSLGGELNSPRWSPDGMRIAFVGGLDIGIMDADGSNRTSLTSNTGTDYQPSWSPDGTQITFVSDSTGDLDIWVMDADGSNKINLTNDPDFNDDPSWSPDKSRIAFIGGNDIWVMDTDGTNQTNLTQNAAGSGDNPHWSRDGSQIVFESAGEIWVMDADGLNQTALTGNEGLDTRPRWSPDGTQIIFRSDRPGGDDIWVMDADGTDQRQLTDSPAILEPLHWWSPDGARIAFQSNRTGDGEIWVMKADGSDLINLTDRPAADDNDPQWRPEQ